MRVYLVLGGSNLFRKHEGLELSKHCFLEIFLYAEVGCRTLFLDWERKRTILSQLCYSAVINILILF